MKDSVCIVTGANSGIGLETARALARQGAEVVMVCRNHQKGEAAKADIQETTQNPDVHLFIADLELQSSIRAFARAFKEQFDRLDVLVNNAGVFIPRREITPDGIEKTFAINHLGYFLLTHLLLEPLLQTPASRVVNVSSDAHRGGGAIDFQNLQLERDYTGYKAYARSKLANIHFTTELARRLEAAYPETTPTVNCLHPGVVSTNITTGKSGFFAFFFKIFSPFFLNAARGAETSIFLATSPDVADTTGKYFQKCKVHTPSLEARDETSAKRLYDVSAKLTGITGITDTPQS